jgi:hypothetical protein
MTVGMKRSLEKLDLLRTSMENPGHPHCVHPVSSIKTDTQHIPELPSNYYHLEVLKNMSDIKIGTNMSQLMDFSMLIKYQFAIQLLNQ